MLLISNSGVVVFRLFLDISLLYLPSWVFYLSFMEIWLKSCPNLFYGGILEGRNAHWQMSLKACMFGLGIGSLKSIINYMCVVMFSILSWHFMLDKFSHLEACFTINMESLPLAPLVGTPLCALEAVPLLQWEQGAAAVTLWQPSNDHPGLRRRGEGEEGEGGGGGRGEAWQNLLSQFPNPPSPLPQPPAMPLSAHHLLGLLLPDVPWRKGWGCLVDFCFSLLLHHNTFSGCKSHSPFSNSLLLTPQNTQIPPMPVPLEPRTGTRCGNHVFVDIIH